MIHFEKLFSVLLSFALLTTGFGLLQAQSDSNSDTIRGIVKVKTKKTTKPAGQAWVFLTEVPNKAYKTNAKKVMDQTNQSFNPHILPVKKGDTVIFKNSDTVFHTVWLTRKSSGKTLFNKPTPIGQSITYTVQKPGVISVKCGPHPDMQAYIPVLDKPFIKTRTTADGSFSFNLKNIPLPEGKYTLQAWQENRGWSNHVRIKQPGKQQTIELTFDTAEKQSAWKSSE